MNYDNTKTIFIECSYSDKDRAKSLNGKWNKLHKLWSFQVEEDFNEETYNGFKVIKPTKKTEDLNNKFITLTLDVKYKDKARAKELGCKWYSLIKKWGICLNDLEWDEDEWNGFTVLERNYGYQMTL